MIFGVDLLIIFARFRDFRNSRQKHAVNLHIGNPCFGGCLSLLLQHLISCEQQSCELQPAVEMAKRI